MHAAATAAALLNACTSVRTDSDALWCLGQTPYGKEEKGPAAIRERHSAATHHMHRAHTSTEQKAGVWQLAHRSSNSYKPTTKRSAETPLPLKHTHASLLPRQAPTQLPKHRHCQLHMHKWLAPLRLGATHRKRWQPKSANPLYDYSTRRPNLTATAACSTTEQARRPPHQPTQEVSASSHITHKANLRRQLNSHTRAMQGTGPSDAKLLRAAARAVARRRERGPTKQFCGQYVQKGMLPALFRTHPAHGRASKFAAPGGLRSKRRQQLAVRHTAHIMYDTPLIRSKHATLARGSTHSEGPLKGNGKVTAAVIRRSTEACRHANSRAGKQRDTHKCHAHKSA